MEPKQRELITYKQVRDREIEYVSKLQKYECACLTMFKTI